MFILTKKFCCRTLLLSNSMLLTVRVGLSNFGATKEHAAAHAVKASKSSRLGLSILGVPMATCMDDTDNPIPGTPAASAGAVGGNADGGVRSGAGGTAGCTFARELPHFPR